MFRLTPYSADRAQRVVKFFERTLVHTKGEWGGRPFLLEPWQRADILEPLFGTVDEAGWRRYRTAYVEIPRKNGKSEIAAGIALYLLFADGEDGAEIYGAASDRDQASIVFNVAAEMVRRSPVLSKIAKVIDSSKRIIVPSTGSFYRAIPADEAGAHGFNASGIVFDELHTQPNRNLWDVLTTSTGARRQPLTFAITTAGYDRNSICFEQHDYALKTINGVIDDPTYFGYVRGAPDDADWRDEAVWRAANPALGVFRSIDEIRTLARRADQVPALENTFRRLYLNQWTRQETRWLNIAAWDACGDDVDLDDLRGRPCFAGLDLASTTDVAALVLVFPHEGTYTVVPHFWVPGANIDERVRRDRVPYDVWARQGHITATAGNVIDYASIRQTIDGLAQTYQIREIGFDRWGATQLTQEIQDAGLEVVPIGQGFASLSAPTKELLNLVLSRKLRHTRHPVLRWMADNMVVRQDPAGNLKPDKAKSTEKIDGMVALIMALDRALRNPDAGSVYDSRGVVVL